MRRFIITSPAYTGQAEVIYNEAGTLVKIDCTQCNMQDGLMHAFKNRVPANINALEESYKNTQATIIEADFEVSFEMFWNKYDVKHNKKRCEALWNKLSKTKQVKAYYSIDAYNKFLSKNNWRNKQEPDTYLSNETYANEW